LQNSFLDSITKGTAKTPRTPRKKERESRKTDKTEDHQESIICYFPSFFLSFFLGVLGVLAVPFDSAPYGLVLLVSNNSTQSFRASFGDGSDQSPRSSG
jgi:hypothetical protein